MRHTPLLCLLLFTLLPHQALAKEPSTQEISAPKPPAPPESERVDPDPWAIGASLVPGVLLHGSGHFVRGERETAWKLLGLEFLGAGLAVGGIAGLAVTGASDDYNPYLYWTAMSGVALFAGSWVADIFGSVRGRDAAGLGLPVRQRAWVTLSQGYQHVYNPVLIGDHYSRTSLEANLGRWSLDATLWFAPEEDASQRFYSTMSWRPWGATTWDESVDETEDGSFLELWGGYAYHHIPEARVSEHMAEIGGRSRWDLARFSETMESMFTEFAIGLGFGAYNYYGVDVTEGAQLLLGEVAVGLYLGDDPAGWSEIKLFYNHRHDGFAAGTKVAGLGSGNLGHAGVRGRIALWKEWGVEAGFAAGSAYVTDLNVVWRFGGSR